MKLLAKEIVKETRKDIKGISQATKKDELDKITSNVS